MLGRLTGFLLFNSFVFIACAQTVLQGRIIGADNEPVTNATITIEGTSLGTVTDESGNFSINLTVSTDIVLVVSHISFVTRKETIRFTNFEKRIQIVLTLNEFKLEQVEVEGKLDVPGELRQNEMKVSPIAARALPSAFGDFSKVLVTLPGVASNNELSTTYSVRGGNFEENLVYVDDIPVYRPFLANAGRQEGLSFVNPDMVSDISFYAGGWEAKYGDKLSSSLNINYKEPKEAEGSITLGLLGGNGYLGGSNTSNRVRYLVGIRHKDSRYLLNTLEVQGEYFPKYTDVQSLITFDLTKKKSYYQNKTKLNWLFSYGRNRYLTQPTSQQTEFGSVIRNFRLNTAFIGRETLDYDTYQTGVRLSHWVNTQFKTNVILSAVRTSEKEFFEVEGAYRLCDVDNDPGSGTFDKCTIIRGIGTQFDYGRNTLEATIATIETRNEWMIDLKNVLEFGAGVTYQDIKDAINEYSFLDSADYSSITHTTFNELSLINANYYGFGQYTLFAKDSVHLFNFGIRANYRTESNQMLLSPRIQYQIRPVWSVPTRFNFSVGLYQQHPFYREMRDRDGAINRDVKAQKSLHAIIGMDQFLTLWGRPFVFTTQAYYKHLWDLNPYEVDNIRIRYYADNIATGYATGLDFRINGEFIQGTQSWFSLSFLKTEEDITGDDRGYIRRPSDQRINLGIFFEDHFPSDPTLRVYLNMNFGSGYPFGPPGSDEYRNVFSGDEYYRVDLGFTKLFFFRENQLLNNFAVRLEVLNALAADNTISYSWIEDVNGTSFAIPNSLSARYFNLKVTADF